MSFLKKVEASSDFKFKASFALKDVYGSLPGVDGEYSIPRSSKVELKYEIDMEVRSWGIKNLNVLIPDQTITFKVELDDEDQTVQDVQMPLKGVEVELMVADDLAFNFGINPFSIEIHNSKTTVTFGAN